MAKLTTEERVVVERRYERRNFDDAVGELIRDGMEIKHIEPWFSDNEVFLGYKVFFAEAEKVQLGPNALADINLIS